MKTYDLAFVTSYGDQMEMIEAGDGHGEWVNASDTLDIIDTLRQILPMAETWFRREFDDLCDHEPGECHCDREAIAREYIRRAVGVLKGIDQ